MPTYLAIFGCTVVILIEIGVGISFVLKGLQLLAQQANTHYEFTMRKLDVQPPLADEKPQPVKVTIKPSRADWKRFMDFEASQQATMEEFKEN